MGKISVSTCPAGIPLSPSFFFRKKGRKRGRERGIRKKNPERVWDSRQGIGEEK